MAENPEEPASGSPDPRRLGSWWLKGRWRSVGVVTLLVVLPTVAFLVGRRAQTLEESVADAAPPTPSVITAEVERRVLETGEVFRGEVTTDVVIISATTSDGTVVTKVPASPGIKLEEGDVVAELDDRPVILLKGNLPLARDLMPGDSGSVVRQLQRSLSRLGLRKGVIDGVYTADTSDAVAALFDRAGYDPPAQVGVEELETAQREVEIAEFAVRSAGRAYRAVRDSGASTGDVLDALNVAREQLARTEEAVGAAELLVGVPTLVANVVFVEYLPSTVLDVFVEVGDVPDVEATLATVSSGDPAIRVFVRQQDASLFVEGETVELRDDAGSFSVQGTITLVEEAPPVADGGGTALSWVVTVAPDEVLTLDLVGSSIQVVTGLRTSDGPTLVVPSTAIRSLADGTFYVIRISGDGVEHRVSVAVGIQGSGFVSVSPPDDQSLDSGDRVVVGAASNAVSNRDG